MFKKFKILVDEGNIEDVEKELARLGYKTSTSWLGYEDYLIAYNDGYYTFRINGGGEKEVKLTDLIKWESK